MFKDGSVIENGEGSLVAFVRPGERSELRLEMVSDLSAADTAWHYLKVYPVQDRWGAAKRLGPAPVLASFLSDVGGSGVDSRVLDMYCLVLAPEDVIDEDRLLLLTRARAASLMCDDVSLATEGMADCPFRLGFGEVCGSGDVASGSDDSDVEKVPEVHHSAGASCASQGSSSGGEFGGRGAGARRDGDCDACAVSQAYVSGQGDWYTSVLSGSRARQVGSKGVELGGGMGLAVFSLGDRYAVIPFSSAAISDMGTVLRGSLECERHRTALVSCGCDTVGSDAGVFAHFVHRADVVASVCSGRCKKPSFLGKVEASLWVLGRTVGLLKDSSSAWEGCCGLRVCRTYARLGHPALGWPAVQGGCYLRIIRKESRAEVLDALGPDPEVRRLLAIDLRFVDLRGAAKAGLKCVSAGLWHCVESSGAVDVVALLPALAATVARAGPGVSYGTGTLGDYLGGAVSGPVGTGDLGSTLLLQAGDVVGAGTQATGSTDVSTGPVTAAQELAYGAVVFDFLLQKLNGIGALRSALSRVRDCDPELTRALVVGAEHRAAGQAAVSWSSSLTDDERLWHAVGRFVGFLGGDTRASTVLVVSGVSSSSSLTAGQRTRGVFRLEGQSQELVVAAGSVLYVPRGCHVLTREWRVEAGNAPVFVCARESVVLRVRPREDKACSIVVLFRWDTWVDRVWNESVKVPDIRGSVARMFRDCGAHVTLLNTPVVAAPRASLLTPLGPVDGSWQPLNHYTLDVTRGGVTLAGGPGCVIRPEMGFSRAEEETGDLSSEEVALLRAASVSYANVAVRADLAVGVAARGGVQLVCAAQRAVAARVVTFIADEYSFDGGGPSSSDFSDGY